MNSQIEDLMDRAGLLANGCWDKMDDYDHRAVEKLIELIVKESASIVENDGRFTRYDKLANKIKDHFGIK